MSYWPMLTGTAGAILIGVWCVGNGEYYSSIDVQTGMRSHTEVYGPFRWHTLQQSALSRVLVQSGYRDASRHQWVCEHASGRRMFRFSYCGLGAGDSIRQCIDSPEVASAVRLMIANSDKPTVEKWLARIFDPDSSFQARWCLLDVEQHTNKEDFLKWIQEQDAEFIEARQIQTNQ